MKQTGKETNKCKVCGCGYNECDDPELGKCWKVEGEDICSHCKIKQMRENGEDVSVLILDSIYWWGEAGL